MSEVSYSYDASGNLTADGVHNYQYDAESRMVTVDVNTASSSYDSANRRVKKVAGGVTTHYVWEGSQVIAEYNGSTGALVSEYVFAGSRMVAREQSGELRYFLQDRLSTRLITDSSGSLVGREDHLPFGEDSGTGSGESEKHRFTSYERDSESGSDYAVNRQYALSTGRFMRPDPITGTNSVPQSLNRYAYVQNDPINSVDPYGLFPIIILPPINLGQIGEITVTAQPDPIIPIGIGLFQFGPGEFINVSISVESLVPTRIPSRLSPCLQKLFDGFFTTPNFLLRLPLDLNSVRLHTGLPAITKFAVMEVGAITLGKDIYFSGLDSFTIATAAHELAHVEQYGQFAAIAGVFSLTPEEKEQAGIQAFAAAYGADYLRGLLQGKSSQQAQRDIFLERQARAKTRAILKKIGQEGRKTCGVPLGNEEPE